MVSEKHPIGMGRSSHPLDMSDDGDRSHPHPKPSLVGTPAQIHILSEHEVGLVEAAELLECRPANYEEGARHPVDPTITTLSS